MTKHCEHCAGAGLMLVCRPCPACSPVPEPSTPAAETPGDLSRVRALVEKYETELKRLAQLRHIKECRNGWVPALTMFTLLQELAAALGAPKDT